VILIFSRNNQTTSLSLLDKSSFNQHFWLVKISLLLSSNHQRRRRRKLHQSSWRKYLLPKRSSNLILSS
jgi:hypothetical protein